VVTLPRFIDAVAGFPVFAPADRERQPRRRIDRSTLVKEIARIVLRPCAGANHGGVGEARSAAARKRGGGGERKRGNMTNVSAHANLDDEEQCTRRPLSSPAQAAIHSLRRPR